MTTNIKSQVIIADRTQNKLDAVTPTSVPNKVVGFGSTFWIKVKRYFRYVWTFRVQDY